MINSGFGGKMRNIINLFGKIKSFEIVTLSTIGMRHVTDYEIVKSGENAISRSIPSYTVTARWYVCFKNAPNAMQNAR